MMVDPVTGLWSGPVPDRGPSVACMGCPSPIWPTKVPRPDAPGELLYEDSAGITVCMKAAEIPVPAGGYVFHRPMPAVR